ncbi:MAG: hypothetical protein WC107_00180 [Patescibacteria group bacterium]
MKTKIKIDPIADNKTNVLINSAEHRILEIKKEIRGVFEFPSRCKTRVFEMWED